MEEEFGALTGIKVLDLGRMVAAPYCTMMLANLGAEVIKVEQPGSGDLSRENLPFQNGISAYFIAYNCSKSGITLDLKAEKGKEILWKLIEWADVLVENFRPGVMERLGFGYEQVSKVNPGLVYASISGYGQDGPYAKRAAFDPIAQAMSGMMSITGMPDGPNVRCGASIADVLAGQNAAVAILAALRYREKSRRGQYIDIALADSCISAMASVNQIYLSTGKNPGPLGNGFEASAPGNSYKTRDGSVMLLAGSNREWKKLAIALHREDWLEDPDFQSAGERVNHRSKLDSLINNETGKYSTAELLDCLLTAGLPVGEVLRVDQVAQSAHFRDVRKMFSEVQHPIAGNVEVTNLPIKMSETPPHITKCAPTLGQDNNSVLSEIGYTEEEILEFKRQRVI